MEGMNMSNDAFLWMRSAGHDKIKSAVSSQEEFKINENVQL